MTPERFSPLGAGPSSLRRRLLVALVGPLLILIVGSAVFSYHVALDAATTAYDRSLLDPALALAKLVDTRRAGEPIALPEAVLDALRTDALDRVYYRIVDAGGATLAGTSALGPPPPPEPGVTHVFFDTALGGEPLRAVALAVQSRAGPLQIEVAETLVKRNALVREVLIGTVVPELVVTLAAGLLLWFATRRGLAPLDALRQEIAARSPADLRPVPEAGAPEEVRPLVRTLNGLLTRLRNALSSQEQFIGNAAHQLRTPLAGLSAHAELALREPASGELKRLLGSVYAETQRTAHLVNQLLALTRAEPGGAPHASREPADLAAIVNEGATPWVHRALERDIDLGFDLASARLLGEPALLRELVGNLLDNAINYTPRGGSVTVRTRTEASRTILQVEDTGPGIDPALRPRVTERFFRLPGTPGDGCGLGLAIVQDITLRHGGAIELRDGRDGRGLLVNVTFPALAANAPQHRE